MTATMQRALGLVATYAINQALVSTESGDRAGGEALAAIAEMLGAIADDRASPLAKVAETRRINGRNYLHNVQTQHALAIAAHGMSVGMDRASALKAAASVAGRTAKGLQNLGIPADRIAFKEWFDGPDAVVPREIINRAVADLTAAHDREPTWREFADHVGDAARRFGARDDSAPAKEAAIRALFKARP